MSNQTNVDGGIGIINFLKHKNYFITGSTGFTAKVFVEKLLREVPEVQKIYLLLRAKDAEDAQQRLKAEIIECELFKRLKREHGERYEEFMRSKLVVVVGNLYDPGLGMDTDMSGLIATHVDVIIHSAGNTKWADRYDVLLDVNVRAVSRLVEYAMNCKKLIVFLHVSTVYVTPETKQVIMEESIEEKQSLKLNAPDIEAEFQLVTKLASSGIPKDKLPTEMVKFGFRRAKIHGYENAYLLTKAMGEMKVAKLSDKLSTVIIRPPFIKSSIREPFCGWIEGYRGMDPMILLHGKGCLQRILADPKAIIDAVPVDMLINAMIAATANHGTTCKHGLHIYHVASSLVNPLTCQNIFKYSYNYFTMHPLKNSTGEVITVKDMDFYASMDEYILVGLDDMPSNSELYRKLVRMAGIYGAIMFCKVGFNIKSTQLLFEKMSLKEKEMFNFDVKSIDWEDYFLNIHISGIRRHLLKEKFLSPKL